MAGTGSLGTLTALATGAATVVGSAMMLTRVLRPTLEARQYIRDIGTATENAQHNLTALAQLERTRELAAALPQKLDGKAG
jgi:hypothetical protein